MTKQKVGHSTDDRDLFPPAEAKRRTDALLRNLLNTPPIPHALKAKKKRAKPTSK